MVANLFQSWNDIKKASKAKFNLNWSFPHEVVDFDDLSEHLKLLDDIREDVAVRRNIVKPLHEKILAKQCQLENARDRRQEKDVELKEVVKMVEELQVKKLRRAEKLEELKKEQDQRMDTYGHANEKGEVYVNRAKELLGLSVAKSTTNSTVIIFTHVDRLNPQRQFLCEITLIGPEERDYKVLRTEPQIDDIDAMEQRLNETNDLSAFVCTLRQRFQASTKH